MVFQSPESTSVIAKGVPGAWDDLAEQTESGVCWESDLHMLEASQVHEHSRESIPLFSKRDKRSYEHFTFSSHYIFSPCLKGYRIKIRNVNDKKKGMFVR